MARKSKVNMSHTEIQTLITHNQLTKTDFRLGYPTIYNYTLKEWGSLKLFSFTSAKHRTPQKSRGTETNEYVEPRKAKGWLRKSLGR